MTTTATAFSPLEQRDKPTVDALWTSQSPTQKVVFTDTGSTCDFPIDEISKSLSSGEIAIPNNLKTAEELDEWIMSL